MDRVKHNIRKQQVRESDNLWRIFVWNRQEL